MYKGVDFEGYSVSFPCSDLGLTDFKTNGSHAFQDSIFMHASDICLQALIAVANVYGSLESQDSPAGKLLSSYDVSLSVVSILDAVLHGDR